MAIASMEPARVTSPYNITLRESGARLVAVTATPQIVIHPYDNRWPAEFATAEGLLREALGDAADRIDHIGSTSDSIHTASGGPRAAKIVRRTDREQRLPSAVGPWPFRSSQADPCRGTCP